MGMGRTNTKTGLNDRQRAFCREYFRNPSNATQAAIKVGYSPKTAYSQAGRLLKNVEVRAEIERLRKAAEDSAIMDRNEACRILSAIARSNVSDFFDESGRIAVRPDEAPAGDPRAVEAVKQTLDGDGNPVIQFRLVSKVAAIERLAKLMGWDAPVKQNMVGEMTFSVKLPDDMPNPESAGGDGHGDD
jgi:phage terminase small subunit